MAFILLVAIIIALAPNIQPSTLKSLVDVKGNGAIREIRILYDQYEEPAYSGMDSNKTRIGQWYKPSRNVAVMDYGRSSSSNSIDGEKPLFGGDRAKTWKAKFKSLPSAVDSSGNHFLVRGKPMFVEVDFVPKYIPQQTYQVAISVSLPAHIRGRPWILGWHQEVFPIPSCRLCTNTHQSFTLPVTLFLQDDGWCAEGRVATIWKIEAIPRESERDRLTADQIDLTLAFCYDEHRQLAITNDQNSTVHCRGISEAIIN